jgi:hypothetical protein
LRHFPFFFGLNRFLKKAEGRGGGTRRRDEAEEQNKKDNPKVILYEFLNLIENQEKKSFCSSGFLKTQLMLQKKRLNFESFQMEDPHLSQDFEIREMESDKK